MTVVIRVPGTFSNPTGQKFLLDPILTNGSLLLWEPGHPADPLVGVPANGAKLRNLADTKAASLMAGDLRVPWEADAGAAVWRSTKGGLVVKRKAGTLKRAGARPPLPLLSQILANIGHNRYVSFWGGISEAASAFGGRFLALSDSNTPSSNNINVVQSGGSGVTGLLTASYTAGSTGMRQHAYANQTVGGTRDKDAAATYAQSRLFGNLNGAGVSALPTDTESVAQATAVWRVYIEDLTISGRSAADVLAIDQALYNQYVTTVGGRYNGDTFTEPA